MNAPTPGWHPDPTGRHEYRYWEGGAWTDDVSDGGATSVDPIDGAPAPTAAADPTQQYAPQYGTQQPGPQSGAFPCGPAYGGYPSSSGQFPPGQPVKSGPSTGLLVGLAALAVALIAGIAFLVTNSGGDDDDTATDETSSTNDSGDADDTSDSTAPEDTEGDGDLGLDDIDEDTSTDGVVDLLAAGLMLESDQLTEEQAQCAAQLMVDELGVESLMEMGTSGTNPFTDGSMTTEQQAAIVTGMTECIPADILMDFGTGG